MKKVSFFSQLGQRLNHKTSFAPVLLLLLAFLFSALSGLSAEWPIDIFGWLATSFLLSSLVLFAAQILLGIYHLLTGKGGSQGTITDLKLPDRLHKKTSFLPIILFAAAMGMFLLGIYEIEPFIRIFGYNVLLSSLPFALMIIGAVLLIWNFVFGVYALIRDITERQPKKDD